MTTYIISNNYTKADLQAWDDNSIENRKLCVYLVNANKVIRIVVMGKHYITEHICYPQVLEDYLSKAILGTDYTIK